MIRMGRLKMRKSSVLAVLAAGVVALASQAALAEGDVTHGKKVFKKCAACHSLEAGKKKVGPSLAGLFVDIEREDTGSITYPGPPYIMPGIEQSLPAPAPQLGQHNEEVLCGTLGWSHEQLVKLYQTGII